MRHKKGRSCRTAQEQCETTHRANKARASSERFCSLRRQLIVPFLGKMKLDELGAFLRLDEFREKAGLAGRRVSENSPSSVPSGREGAAPIANLVNSTWIESRTRTTTAPATSFVQLTGQLETQDDLDDTILSTEHRVIIQSFCKVSLASIGYGTCYRTCFTNKGWLDEEELGWRALLSC